MIIASDLEWTRICSKCKLHKNRDQFPKSKNTSGYGYWCKLCKAEHAQLFRMANRERINKAVRDKYTPQKGKAQNLKRYGLSLDSYTNKLNEQQGKCKICDEAEKYKTGHGIIRTLSVDHNHSTGKIRDLLCNRCNRIIGLVKESPTLLRDMADYLELHEDNSV